MKRVITRKNIKYWIFFLVVIIFCIGMYRGNILSQIPATQKSIPVRITEEEVPIPKRPGTQSIRITGPPLRPIKFQIDFKQNPMPLDWTYLEKIDKRADVMIEGRVDEKGDFSVSKIRDRGHPEAGKYVNDILSTWRFMPYKKGVIKFYFNVPTRKENMKVQIDLRRLEKNFDYVGPNDYLTDGALCYVQGIDNWNIMLIR